MPKATLRGIDFYYELHGTEAGRPRLLFINGTGGDLRQRPSLVEGPLTGQMEVLAHDQRGLGQSGKPNHAYMMADYADDAAALLDHVGWDTAHVLGVSFGGMVAQEFALRHPSRINKLVLACTSSGGEGNASYPLHELAALGPDDYMTQILMIGDTRWAEKAEARGPDAFAKIAEFMKARQQVPEDGESAEVKAVGAQRQLDARLGHDTWDRLASIQHPTLLIGGRYDGIAPAVNMENLQSRIPDAVLEFFEGGHGFLLEDRSAFPRILEFLGAA
jgi:3-oxoadipate enol-lactonase